jgi:hypothetical protein
MKLTVHKAEIWSVDRIGVINFRITICFFETY